MRPRHARQARMGAVTRIAILGGGPGGYEAALVAAQLGAEVVVVERDGIGGACVLADCVPSKTLIATSESMSAFAGSEALGVRLRGGGHAGRAGLRSMRRRSTPGSRRWRARSRSTSPAGSRREGVEVINGTARFAGPHQLAVRRRRRRAGAQRRRRADRDRSVASGAARRRSRTASESSTGSRSTTCRSCPSTSSWSAPA